MESNIEFIRQKLSQEELLCQLAEEASELAQAALKLRRVLDGTNPTPTNEIDAFSHLVEEVSDVILLIDVFGVSADEEIQTAKLNRWCERMEGRK